MQADGKAATLKRGRCVGCSAIPVAVQAGHFQKKFAGVPLVESPAGSGQPVQLGSRNGVYNLAYAVMKLNGPSATVAYYQDTDPANPLHVETIPPKGSAE